MSSTRIPKQAPRNELHTGRPELLVTIVGRGKADSFMDLIQTYEVNMQMSFAAHGTASAETLNLLGIHGNDKTVIFSIIREDRADECLNAIENRFQSVHKGKGIAFTVPLSSVIGAQIFRFLSNARS